MKDLSLRIGKQQVVWGESDLFRSLDVVNPLDLRQNGAVGEDFADFRQPLWIFKALYDLGNLASFWNEAGIGGLLVAEQPAADVSEQRTARRDVEAQR